MKYRNYHLYIFAILIISTLAYSSHQHVDVLYPDNFSVRFSHYTQSAIVSHKEQAVHIAYYNANSEVVRYENFMFTRNGYLIRCKQDSDIPVQIAYVAKGTNGVIRKDLNFKNYIQS